MIKKIIHISDLHIRPIKRHEEYKTQLIKAIESFSEIASEYEFDEVRIVITGDIFHTKIDISNEQIDLFSWFLRELAGIAPVIIIGGNHDLLENNIDRMDSLTPIIRLMKLNNVKFLDMELNYKSGIYVDNNIVWCLYSIFDHYNIPEIKIERVNYPDKKFIGLFHGALIGSKTDVGFEFTNGFSTSIFDGCHVVLCGDIHKKQELNYKETKIVYPGSLIQQDFGESVSNHGFLLWDVDTLEYEEHDIESEYGFYKFRITSINDVDNQTEEFINF